MDSGSSINGEGRELHIEPLLSPAPPPVYTYWEHAETNLASAPVAATTAAIGCASAQTPRRSMLARAALVERTNLSSQLMVVQPSHGATHSPLLPSSLHLPYPLSRHPS